MPSTLPADATPLTRALATLLDVFQEDADGGKPIKDALKKLERDPAIKSGLAPVAGPLKWGGRASTLMHHSLEQPAGSPLREAAEVILARGLYTEPVHVALSPTPRPHRTIMQVLPSRVAPVIYGSELSARVTIWSSENGAHLGDLALKRGSRPSELVELPDGTLRALTTDGDISERAPGQDAFSPVMSLRPKGLKHFSSHAHSADLHHHLVAINDYIVEGPDGPRLDFQLHDITAPKKPRPFSIEGSDWLGDVASFGPTTASVVHARGSDEVQYVLGIVDLVEGRVLQSIPLQGSGSSVQPSADGKAALMYITDDEGTTAWWRVELADGKHTAIAKDAIDPESGEPRELDPAGLTYDESEQAVRGPDGAIVARYTPPGLLHATSVKPGPKPGWFLIVGRGDEGTLTLIAPHDPARVPAAVAPPEPLDWARPGTVLTYAISDYDADDTYRFRITDTTDDSLTLAIVMINGDDDDGETEEVAAALHFSSKALTDAATFVTIAQGGVDVDDTEAPVDDRLPPWMLGRASFARLCRGETVAFSSVWTSGDVALAGAEQTHSLSIAVDGSERLVAARRFEGSNATVIALDDARWPLILDRAEGDCQVRLESLTLPKEKKAAGKATKAAGKTASKAASNRQAPASETEAPATGGTRRFEAAEGGVGKFWEITVSGSDVTVRFGKLGAAGQTQTKTQPSASQAEREAARLVAEKTKKGYRPVG